MAAARTHAFLLAVDSCACGLGGLGHRVRRAQRTATTTPEPSGPGHHPTGPPPLRVCARQVMDIFMARTKPRIAMTYRSIGSGAGGTEFNASFNAFAIGDVPVSQAVYDSMTSRGRGVVHLPFLVGSVSVFQSVPGVGKVGEGGGRAHRLRARCFRPLAGGWPCACSCARAHACRLCPATTHTRWDVHGGSAGGHAPFLGGQVVARLLGWLGGHPGRQMQICSAPAGPAAPTGGPIRP